jgi:small multidrug resistance pump
MTNVGLIFLVLTVVCFESVAQKYCKTYSNDKKYCYLAIAIFFYALVAVFLSRAQENTNIGVVNSLWSGLSVVSVCLVGYLFFGQTITPKQGGAILLILIGVCYLVSTS